MLSLLGQKQRFCDGVTRRSFLQVGGLAMGGLSLPALLRAEANSPRPERHKSVIMVFLPGGPSHLDIWDLKPDAPVEIRGEFRPIHTAIPGVQLCEHLPLLSQQVERFAIIRSLVGAKNEHASELCFSGYGYQDSLVRQQPSLGAAASKLLGAVDPSVPPFVSLCHTTPNLWRDPGRAGFLGPAHRPFQPAGEDRQNMVLDGVTLSRLGDRKQLRDTFDRFRRGVDTSGVMDSVDVYTRQALEVLTSGRLLAALDLDQEPDSVRDHYGRHLFGQGLLLARRLSEAGIPFVNVYWIDPEPAGEGGGEFDSHGRIYHHYPKRLLPPTDRALAALLEDVHDRGLLEDTLVTVMGEFGRTPRINPRTGRDHFPKAFNVALSGGGVRGGQIIGKTSADGMEVIKRPVEPKDLFCSFCHSLKLDPRTETMSPVGRPIKIVEGGTRIDELFG